MRPQSSALPRFRKRTNPAYTLLPSGSLSVSREAVATQQAFADSEPRWLTSREKAGLDAACAYHRPRLAPIAGGRSDTLSQSGRDRDLLVILITERTQGRWYIGPLARGGWQLGVPMKARQLIENSSFGPDQVKAMGQALDEAWVQLAPSVDARPESIEAARFALADVILSLAGQGYLDPQWLADTAVHVMKSRSSRCQP